MNSHLERNRPDLLQALNAAALVLNQASLSWDNVLNTTREQIEHLGLRGGILLLDDDRKRLIVRSVAQPIKIITTLEKLTGFSVIGHAFDYSCVEVYRMVIDQGQAVYSSNSSETIIQLVPHAVQPFLSQILNFFGNTPSIHAPLIIMGNIIGSINVAGKGLSVDDVQSMEAFANHISVALSNARLFSDVKTVSEELKLSNQDLMSANKQLREEIAEREKLEAQLLQAQKMESIGRLAGGIAHDFNNMLTPILAYAEIIISQTAEGDIRREEAANIRQAAQDAGQLTRQLLAFSRKQVFERKALDLNQCVSELEGMLRPLIQENIQIVSIPPSRSIFIYADKTQIMQVLINLTLNARDAMNDGGTLTLETGVTNIESPGEYIASDLKPGPYAKILISDTGTGMDESTIKNIFEPFFTTKKAGKGTGLGLATAYGTVLQHGGTILISSSPGKGSAFTVLLPLTTDPPLKSEEKPKKVDTNSGNGEKLLVVEDNEAVRKLIYDVLTNHGYSVIATRDPVLAEDFGMKTKPDLLVSDMVLPHMSGIQLYTKLEKRYPGLNVLFITGYSEDVLQAADQFSAHVMQKPFTAETLLENVWRALQR